MKDVIIYGIGGKLGRTLYRELQHFATLRCVGGVDKFCTAGFDVPVFSSLAECNISADVIIDFSRPDALDDILSYAENKKTALVLATTGYTDEQRTKIAEMSKHVPVFQSANMSLGVNLLIDLSKKATQFFGSAFDVEIIEQHHKMKVDAPSGTALALADNIKSVMQDSVNYRFGRQPDSGKRTDHEIGIHSIRGGNIVGKHDVLFIGQDETVTLSHEAQSRDVFAQGALRAAEFISDKPVGLYSMKDIIGQDFSVTSVSATHDIALINITNTDMGNLVAILDKFADNGINLDMISQTPSIGGFNVSFTVNNADIDAVIKLLDKNALTYTYGFAAIVRVIGAGMEHKSGVAKDVFNLFVKNGVKILATTTSETQISCCVDESSAEIAVGLIKEFYRF